MSRRSCRPIWTLRLLGLWLASAGAGTLFAQASVDQLKSGYLVNGRQVRRVFRDVVADARAATVRLRKGRKQVALGTIVGSDGWILTKASQMTGADVVELTDGREFPFQTIGYHVPHDLALLRVDAADLPSITWETASPPLGAWLVSAGTRPDPVAVGILSVARRPIPRSDVSGVLGIELEKEELPRIRRVLPNSGASEAGLKAGDLVLEIDRQSIDTGQQLVKTLRNYRPGDRLSLRVRREEHDLAVSVTLTHPFGDFLSRMAFQNQMGGSLSFRRDDFEAAYQYDAVLDPDECGGPVVTLGRSAVGINIARAGRTETYVLPADVVLSVLDDMKVGKYPPLVADDVIGRPAAPALPMPIE